MDAWQDIVRTALVGTERQPPALPAFPGALGTTLASLPTAEPERALLSAASVLSLYQAAGYQPSPPVAAPLAAPPEQLQPVPPRAATHLPDLITGDHAKLLPEFLIACAAAGRRIPHRHLPALLDRAASERDLRDAVVKVIGTRGQWLMSLNPAWQFDTPAGVVSSADHVPDTWQLGTRDQRLAYLKRLRAADPAAARGLVRGTWAQETPEDRAAILATFSVNLSLDDEPLLEESLDDRRKEVRTAAADLLARLPNSQLVSRMLARLKPLLKIEVAQRGKVMKLVAGSKTKVSIDLTPPDACDKACQRDGVEPKPPAHSGIGEKAWLLEEMLAAAPPTAWTDDATPDDLIAAALTTDYPSALVDGWTRAAARHPDPAWARALLAYHLDPPATKKKQPAYAGMRQHAETIQELLRSLPAGDVEPALIAALESNTGKLATHPALPVLQYHDRPWGRDLSMAVLKRLQAELTARSDYELYEFVQSNLGRLLSPDTAPVACNPGWTPPSFWDSPLSKMRNTLQFRHDMLKSLTET